jgi:Tol biopolymer transport system component
VEGGNPRKLEEDIAGRFSSLSIHPDGKRIAFVSTGRTEYSYWVMENLPPIKAAK